MEMNAAKVQMSNGMPQQEALRQFDALTGDSLNRTGAQDGAGSSDKQEKPKKKKGFMDKIKESLDDI